MSPLISIPISTKEQEMRREKKRHTLGPEKQKKTDGKLKKKQIS